jgi:hypothetical protein
MKKFEWEWHCEWIDAYEDVIERHYEDIGDLKKFTDCKLSDYDEAVYMIYGLTLHWNGDGDWTDIEQERAYINEKSEFDLSDLDRKIPKYIMQEFEEQKHLLKPQGVKPHYEI